jgi:hypothetical protein
MVVRFYYLVEEFAQGNQHDKDNLLRYDYIKLTYDYIKLNLPGNPTYDPTQPWVIKWDTTIANITGNIVVFVNELRVLGHSVEQTWSIAMQAVSRLQYLGLQDAPRKRRPPV